MTPIDHDARVPVGQVLVAMTGFPGTGKSALAEAVARAISAPVFSVDPLEATLNRAGITREHRSGYAVYDLAATLAEAQLRLGQSAVVDAVNGLASVRQWWGEIGARYGVRTVTLATVCSDIELHRQRLEQRQRGLDGFLYELTWSDIEGGRTEYEPPTEADLVLDAVEPLTDNAARVLRYLGAETRA